MSVEEELQEHAEHAKEPFDKMVAVTMAIIAAIIEANPAQVEQYRGGKQGLLGFFVGQVMKETGGSADARVVSELVREQLGA